MGSVPASKMIAKEMKVAWGGLDCKCGPKCGPSKLGKEWNGKGLGNRKGILGRPLASAAGI